MYIKSITFYFYGANVMVVMRGDGLMSADVRVGLVSYVNNFDCD